jgi:hypothetical protein
MKTQTITIEQWRREAPQLRAKSAQILAGPMNVSACNPLLE